MKSCFYLIYKHHLLYFLLNMWLNSTKVSVIFILKDVMLVSNRNVARMHGRYMCQRLNTQGQITDQSTR